MDLISTLDDVTSEHYSLFFVDEEGTASSFRGVRDVIEARGLFSSFYSDRGSHYWHTPEAGGKVDKANPTQFGRPGPSGHRNDCRLFTRSPGPFGARVWYASRPSASGIGVGRHCGHGCRQPLSAGRLFTRLQCRICPTGPGGRFGFVPWVGGRLDDILCEQYERTVGADNCVRFENLILQIRQIGIVATTSKAKVSVLPPCRRQSLDPPWTPHAGRGIHRKVH
ncbi:MAG: hypothetical protein IPP85_10015 [Propionivibrio sp.]|nr:hypothetical protein [Propionivibrio sp.]